MKLDEMIQEKAAVNIGIEPAHREAVAHALSLLLADEHVLYVKLRNYHWNVTGPHFKPLHELFEEQYTALATAIDDIAERIRSLGFFVAGSLEAFRGMARLTETGHLNGDATRMLENLLLDHEAIIQILRHDLEAADKEYNDMGTSDFLTGLMEQHEKMAWMIRVHMA